MSFHPRAHAHIFSNTYIDYIFTNLLTVVTEIDILQSNCCVHNPGYHTYYYTNSWEIRDPHRRPQARHEIDYLKHTRWILTNTRTHNLTWFGPNLAYVHGERTWESLIDKLDSKRSNLLLDDTRVFTFPLNLYPRLQEYPSLYAPSSCFFLSWLFRALHYCSP